jgi:4-alpha-glucanotransferase
MDLDAKAHAFGVETEFFDALGQRRRASPETLETVLRSLTPPRHHPLVAGPVMMRSGQDVVLHLHDSAARPIDWAVYRDEASGLQEVARAQADRWPFGGASFASGIYRLSLVDAKGERDDVPLIVAPSRAFAGDFDRTWVIAVQLYSLRSSSNWGIGDFGDLMELLKIAARAGAGGIGLNPLHALFDNHPADCSPYSPNSRLFLNPLYIDVSRAPGFAADKTAGFAERLAALRATDLVDYPAVAELKWSVLRAAYTAFSAHGSSSEHAEFETFRRERGRALLRFGCFEFLRRQHQGPWWTWPQEWRAPDDARLQRLRDGDAAATIGYFEYLQWIADRQLRRCGQLASDLGMPVGLYLDIAVGVKADGFDAWNAPTAIARELSVGAPPDLLNTAGQDWGLASFSAAGLEATLFQPFCDMLAAVMRYAGAIRIDHVLGLQRFYLVPSGASARDGVYVRMPFDALLAAIAIESHQHRCVVIGEDLGTVPEGFRERLSGNGLWCYKVMLFERNYDGSFLAPEYYATDALVTFNTHDLPTFAGWQAGHDLTVKRGLGLDPGETDAERKASLGRFDEQIRAGAPERIFDSVIGFLTRTPSRMLALELEDLLGVADQPNIPGTTDQYPNWRRKLPSALDTFDAKLNIARLRELLAERSGQPSPK